ncbi:MAG TPA: lysophospholipid acyltransferase family protein [Polyangiaceae bacterium]|nr:lysophospholipid acyltransferase family protein [Polyangiaceae bacterium]
MNVRGETWRRAAYAGVRFGPRRFVEYSPAAFGVAWALALPELRARVRENLRRFHGRRPFLAEEADVFRTFVAYAHCFTESLGGERPEAASAVPVVDGREHLDHAIRAGKGVVLVTAHTGAWDVAARFLSRDYSADVLVVMAAEDDAGARAVSDGVRVRSGIRVAHVGRTAFDALPLLGHLRRGGVVAVQLDRAHPESAVEAELCGGPFLVPRGPFHLAMLGGAPIVPVFTRRLGYFRYQVTVRPEIRVPRNGGPEGVVSAARTATRELEEFVRRDPTQWFHFSG